jgi:hypothetical protein
MTTEDQPPLSPDECESLRDVGKGDGDAKSPNCIGSAPPDWAAR